MLKNIIYLKNPLHTFYTADILAFFDCYFNEALFYGFSLYTQVITMHICQRFCHRPIQKQTLHSWHSIYARQKHSMHCCSSALYKGFSAALFCSLIWLLFFAQILASFGDVVDCGKWQFVRGFYMSVGWQRLQAVRLQTDHK